MTNEQFWSELRSLIDLKTTTSCKAISSLFSTATKENLSLLVVLLDDTLQSLSANDLAFAYCATHTGVYTWFGIIYPEGKTSGPTAADWTSHTNPERTSYYDSRSKSYHHTL